jgi:hypothetical protein
MIEAIQEDAEDLNSPDSIKKKWKTKIENKTLEITDIINYFQVYAPYFLTISRKDDGSEIGESHFNCFCVLLR